MKYSLFFSTFIILASWNGIKVNGRFCSHTADVKPPQSSCSERGAYYINHYYDNGCSSVKACLIPAGNNQIFPDSYKAKNPSECVVIENNTYCAADLVEYLPCENCSFPKFMEELKKIMGDKLQYEFSKDTTLTVPPEVLNAKIQCVIPRYMNDEYKKCNLSNGHFVIHEFYPDCETSYFACFYEKIGDIEGVDPNVIMTKDKSKCLVKKDNNYEFSYCAVGYSNIPCKGCTFSDFTKKAKEVFGDYLEKEVGTNKDIESTKPVETTKQVGATKEVGPTNEVGTTNELIATKEDDSSSSGIKIYSICNNFTVIISLLIILLLK